MRRLRDRGALVAGVLCGVALFGFGLAAWDADRPPGAPSAKRESPNGSAIVVLRARASGSLELIAVEPKPFPCPPPKGGGLRYRVEDATTGELVGEGSAPLPDLCSCGGEAHASGCVLVRHEAVVRLKVPYHGRRARVRVRGAGEELAFLVEPMP